MGTTQRTLQLVLLVAQSLVLLLQLGRHLEALVVHQTRRLQQLLHGGGHGVDGLREGVLARHHGLDALHRLLRHLHQLGHLVLERLHRTGSHLTHAHLRLDLLGTLHVHHVLLVVVEALVLHTVLLALSITLRTHTHLRLGVVQV